MKNPTAMKLSQQAESFPLSQVRLTGGLFKELQDMHAKFLLAVEPDRLLAPFRLQAGLPPKAQRYGGWESKDISGHSLGHYLSAISLLFASTGNEILRERVKMIVSELAEFQQANGDGYVLPVNKQAFAELREGKINALPFALNGVWVPFYTLHKLLAGLRDAYRQAENSEALQVAQNVTDWLEQVLWDLPPEQIQEMLKTEHGGMNEVLADLAADTGDDRYLHMAAHCFHHRTVLEPMFRGEDKLDGLHGNTQIPKVIGLAREFELTGEPLYRVAAETFWGHVVNHRSYCNGGHGESEHFFPVENFPRTLTPNTCETCNTYNLLKLTRHLFSWQPTAAHMDFVERALLNHLAANIGRQPGEFGYFLGLGSVGVKAFSTPFDSWWCCVGTGMENPVRYGEQIYSHGDGTLWINLFMASTLDWPEKKLKLRQETQFPESDTVRLVFICERPVQLQIKIRHPYWCVKPELKINGTPATVDSSPAMYFTIDRVWNSGDVIELRLPMTLRIEPLPHSDNKIVALMHGPTVLAAKVQPTSNAPDPAKLRFSDHLSSRGKTDAFPPIIVAMSPDDILPHLKSDPQNNNEFSSQNLVVPEDLKFVPFYKIYEEHYAVYFPVMSAEEWQSRQGELRAEQERCRQIEAATLDSVTPGYQQPEVEHALRAYGSEVEDLGGRKSRFARDGGWFSYELKVETNAQTFLAVTYWGGVWHERSFDIFVDGEKIATQLLYRNKIGEFFDQTYTLPSVLTSGKAKITICFQSRPDDIAGGVFNVRLMLKS